MVAEWLKALFPNSSREPPEGPEFKSLSGQVYAITVIVVMDCDIGVDAVHGS